MTGVQTCALPISGIALATIGLASNRRYKRQDGTQTEDVCFVDVTFFGRTAEVANQYLRKGSKILVEGRLNYESWTDQQGNKRSKHTIIGETMEMLDTKQQSDGYNASNSYASGGGYGSSGSYNSGSYGGSSYNSGGYGATNSGYSQNQGYNNYNQRGYEDSNYSSNYGSSGSQSGLQNSGYQSPQSTPQNHSQSSGFSGANSATTQSSNAKNGYQEPPEIDVDEEIPF